MHPFHIQFPYHVEILNASNQVMAKMEILENGYLMTTAVYGDDPATEPMEGFNEQEMITFRFHGQEIISDIDFEGNMELKKVNLEFASADETWRIYPNPFTTTTTINYELYATSHVSIKIFDVTGRELHQLVNTTQDAANYTEYWDASAFEKGIYIVELHINNSKVATERLVVQ